MQQNSASTNNTSESNGQLPVTEKSLIPNNIANTDVNETMVLSFTNMMTQFLDAMSEVFPECPKVAFYRLGWVATMEDCKTNRTELIKTGKQAIESYVKSMSPYFSMCLSRNAAILNEDIDIMNNIGMREKWTDDLDEETKATFWQYIQHLNEFAHMHQMCNALPSNAVNIAQQMAQDIAGKIESGDMAMSDISLSNLVTEVGARVNPSEIASGMDVDALGDPSMVCAMMASMMRSMNL